MRKTILILFTGVIIIFVFIPNILKATDNLMSDFKKHTPEKRVLESTRELNGTVINSEDKSYKKEKSMFLFIGGGEKEVEKYIIKIKEKDKSIISVKANENQYLRYNKGDKIKVVVDKESNEIKYDMRSDKDKKEYLEYKRLAHDN